MSLRARVSRLDDYAGELGQALEKLEIEQARGALNRDEQEDFLGDLRAAIELRDLRPLRKKIALDLVIAALGAAGLAFPPQDPDLHRPTLLAGAGLLALGLALLAWRLILYLRRRRQDREWLGALEARVHAGGTIFDQP